MSEHYNFEVFKRGTRRRVEKPSEEYERFEALAKTIVRGPSLRSLTHLVSGRDVDETCCHGCGVR